MDKPKKFRKKPVVIEAIRYEGLFNLREVLDFTGKHHKFYQWFENYSAFEKHVANDGYAFKIFTLEGVMTAYPGDWIIRGVNGEHYPCKADIFEETYEGIEQ